MTEDRGATFAHALHDVMCSAQDMGMTNSTIAVCLLGVVWRMVRDHDDADEIFDTYVELAKRKWEEEGDT